MSERSDRLTWSEIRNLARGKKTGVMLLVSLVEGSAASSNVAPRLLGEAPPAVWAAIAAYATERGKDASIVEATEKARDVFAEVSAETEAKYAPRPVAASEPGETSGGDVS